MIFGIWQRLRYGTCDVCGQRGDLYLYTRDPEIKFYCEKCKMKKVLIEDPSREYYQREQLQPTIEEIKSEKAEDIRKYFAKRREHDPHGEEERMDPVPTQSSR